MHTVSGDVETVVLAATSGPSSAVAAEQRADWHRRLSNELAHARNMRIDLHIC
jgi:hypothetical protein